MTSNSRIRLFAGALTLLILAFGAPAIVAADAPSLLTVWNGDETGGGKGWVSPGDKPNSMDVETDDVHGGKTALRLHGEGKEYIGGGWNWHGWWPEGSGENAGHYKNLVFWVKVTGPAKPQLLQVGLVSSGGKHDATKWADIGTYTDGAQDGKWHEVVIPFKDFVDPAGDFDLHRVWEIDVNTWSPDARNFNVDIDDIAFDNRGVRSKTDWVTLPEARAATALPAGSKIVTATVDTKAAGTPISPYIYGAAMGDRKEANEIGLTIERAGGNPATPVNWKHGFGSNGNDWYFTNSGTETPPEKNWLVTFQGENKKAGLESYVTIPMMGRVAKDGTSVAFPMDKYPNQESHDHNAGNGRMMVAGKMTDIPSDLDATSVAMSPEEQTQMFSFMVHDMGYGTADKGGVKFLALDNEPGIWHTTHRGMHPEGMSYDELWTRTKTYASLLKKIDPTVQIAGPTAWGWTEYFVSGKDVQMITQGKGTWAAPPDRTAHGNTPLMVWYMQQLHQYQQQTGVRLVDILDFHFYPQTGISFGGGVTGDPATMEGRIQETRALWDPTWTDPSWMTGDANAQKQGGHLEVIRMIKGWIKQYNPGMGLSLGEYNWGGDNDVSGGLAQAELLGVFAREGLSHAFYWFMPAPNSSTYFGFKLFRNPDGNHTAFGDVYLPGTVSAPDDVSVHAARDSKTGKLTFVLINKRAAQGAHVTLTLTDALPSQSVTAYEYSRADRSVIGQLPARTISGKTLTVDLAPLSAQRFDVKP